MLQVIGSVPKLLMRKGGQGANDTVQQVDASTTTNTSLASTLDRNSGTLEVSTTNKSVTSQEAIKNLNQVDVSSSLLKELAMKTPRFTPDLTSNFSPKPNQGETPVSSNIPNTPIPGNSGMGLLCNQPLTSNDADLLGSFMRTPSARGSTRLRRIIYY